MLSAGVKLRSMNFLHAVGNSHRFLAKELWIQEADVAVWTSVSKEPGRSTIDQWIRNSSELKVAGGRNLGENSGRGGEVSYTSSDEALMPVGREW